MFFLCFTAATDTKTITTPLCGVLTKEGYHVHETKAQFGEKAVNAILVAPVSSHSPSVRRYQIIDDYRMSGFLEAHINWWVCVTKGEVVKDVNVAWWRLFYSEQFTGVGALSGLDLDYGIIKVEDFSADMTNGERGAE